MRTHETNVSIAEIKAMVDGIHGSFQGLRAGLDDQAKLIAGLRIGGGGGHESGNLKAAYADLHKFLASGRFAPRADMATDSSPDGGYLTLPEIDSQIATFMQNEQPMRRICRVQPTASGTFAIPFSQANASSGWVGERQSRPKTDSPTLAMLEIPVFEIYAMPKATQTMLDDSMFNIEDFVNSEVATEFAREEGSAFISGDGVNKPRGLLTYTIVSTSDATRTFGQLQYVPSGVAAAISDGSNNGGDALITMVYTLASGYRRNARWLMNSLTAGVVRKLKDAEDRYLWVNPLSESQPPLLLGYPVEFDENMPDIGAGTYPIAFGDWKAAYIIVDRIGIRILRDPFTDKPWVNFYTTKRVGGSLVDSRAVKLLKVATT